MKRLAATFAALMILTGCGQTTYSTDFFAMDTFMSVTVQGKQAEAIAISCEQRINMIEREVSRTRTDSEIYELNHAAGQPVQLSGDSAALMAQALTYYEETNGLYDPTVAPLTDLWGIGTEQAHIPSAAEIQNALNKVGFENNVTSNTETHTTVEYALQNDAAIDLGGIAKGFAADACAQILYDANVSGLLVLGGNIYAVGANEGKDWVIGIADPDAYGDYIATVAGQDISVVTSGDYERYFEENGVRYHHIFDPRTGYPAASGLRSVSVIDPNSTRADAMTTALFVMGLEDGMAFCQEKGLAAVFVTSDRMVYTTDAVNTVCTFSFAGEDKGYHYAQ